MTPMEPSRTRERIARHIQNIGHPDTALARRAEGFKSAITAVAPLKRSSKLAGTKTRRQPWVAGRTIG